MSVAFGADGQVLASASWDRTVKLWIARTGQELRTLRGHSGTVNSVAFTADGQVLASAGGFGDNTVKLWDARTGRERHTLRGHTGTVNSVAFAADGQMLASASLDGTVKLWDTRTGRERHTLRGHTRDVWSVAFSADGQVLASASDDNTVKLWDARTGQELHTLRGHTNKVRSVAFAGDGRVLASASDDNTVKLWDARTGQQLRTLAGHTNVVRSVAFPADGQVLASASGGRVKLWDTRTGQELRTLHATGLRCMAFAADGQVLASVSADDTINLSDMRTEQQLCTLRGHTSMVWTVAFPADGQVLASASVDGTVKLWDTRTTQDPEKERRFRLWVTAPDLHQHREIAGQADKDKQPFALAFRLGRYLAGKNFYAAGPRDAASLASWLGTAPQLLTLLAGLPVHVKTPFHEPIFPDGIACTGVLYKDSGILPARLLTGTTRALEGDPSNWLNHAFHGGALYRNGEHAKALVALTRAVELHGKPNPLTHHLLALACLKLGQNDKAREYATHAGLAKDAPWEDVMVQRLLRPEVDAAFADGEGKRKEP